VHVREEQPHEVEEVARRAVALGRIVEAVHGLDHVDLRPAHVVDCHHHRTAGAVIGSPGGSTSATRKRNATRLDRRVIFFLPLAQSRQNHLPAHRPPGDEEEGI
jgi:hypothetical protein